MRLVRTLATTAMALFVSATVSAQIENFHALSDQIFRSAAPTKGSTYLKQAGFTHVLIFKNENKNEVTRACPHLTGPISGR